MKKPNYKVNPLLKDLPDFLKNPANFIPVKKQLLETLAIGHSHSDLESYAVCEECTNKMIDRRKLLKKLGFKSPSQYLAWCKVHEEIARQYPLVDWSMVNAERALEIMKKQ